MSYQAALASGFCSGWVTWDCKHFGSTHSASKPDQIVYLNHLSLSLKWMWPDRIVCVALIVAVGGHSPEIVPTAWVAPNATLIGQVRIAAHASVYYGAVLRGDIEPIVLGEGSNIQDNCVVHTDIGAPAIIGANVGVGHGAIIHGATVGDGALVGMGAMLLSGSAIGEGAFVAAGALVREGQHIPEHHLALGVPAKDRGVLDEDSRDRVVRNAREYIELTKLHRSAQIGNVCE